MTTEKPLTYRDAGVDIDAKMAILKRVTPAIRATWTGDVLGEPGGFGSLFRAPGAPFQEPILVASTDGIGTKIKIASRVGRYDTLGLDLVNHCVNDILVQGARPLFFLDYIAVGKMSDAVVGGLVLGLARACRENGCALIGGETAQMPGLYQPADFDVAGFIVGVVDRANLLDGSRIRAGDVLIGLPSSGLHTNGFSLAQRVLFENERKHHEDVLPEIGRSLGEELLEPHRSYLRPLLPLVEAGRLHGLAHITGGGFPDNVVRVLPAGLCAVIRFGTWEIPPIFTVIRERGRVPLTECLRVFNMGIGMVLFVDRDQETSVLGDLTAYGLGGTIIGEVVAGDRSVVIQGV
ncbi:MAG: phosphoribosylformylglycinamidine cyclo-ligase [Planctomycetota bacterium]